MSRSFVSALVVACALLLSPQVSGRVSPPAAVAQGTAPSPATTISLTDRGLEAPDTLPSGFVSLTFSNRGTRLHSGQLLRLISGTTLAQATAALANVTDDPATEAAFNQLVAYAGGVGELPAGVSQTVVMNLRPGSYAVFDSDAGPQDALKAIRIGNDQSSLPPPQAGYNFTETEFAFAGPSTIAPGANLFRVTNSGGQNHEMTIYKIGTHTLADVQAAVRQDQPDWATAAGGIAVLAPGTTAWLQLNLDPSNYALICFLTDPETGQPHAFEGMAAVITVGP